jgi:hypothetical protein
MVIAMGKCPQKLGDRPVKYPALKTVDVQVDVPNSHWLINRGFSHMKTNYNRYPLVNKQKAIENGPVEIAGDFPVCFVTVYQRVFEQ